MISKKHRTLKGISYGRVSTDAQFKDIRGIVKEDASPMVQMQRCLEYVKGLSLQKSATYEIIEHLEDLGYSGKTTDRPDFQKLVRLIEQGQIDFVVVTELSRISRTTADFHNFFKQCKDNDVELHLLDVPGLDTS